LWFEEGSSASPENVYVVVNNASSFKFGELDEEIAEDRVPVNALRVSDLMPGSVNAPGDV